MSVTFEQSPERLELSKSYGSAGLVPTMAGVFLLALPLLPARGPSGPRDAWALLALQVLGVLFLLFSLCLLGTSQTVSLDRKLGRIAYRSTVVFFDAGHAEYPAEAVRELVFKVLRTHHVGRNGAEWDTAQGTIEVALTDGRRVALATVTQDDEGYEAGLRAIAEALGARYERFLERNEEHHYVV